MPRRKPTEVIERRRTLGTWERNLEETRVAGEVIRNVGVGFGSAVGPFSLIGAAILAGIFFKNPIEDAIEDAKKFFAKEGPLDPNTGDADDYINEQMNLPGVPGEPSAMGKYIAGKVAQFDARKEAFTKTGGTGWEAYKEANPIPLEVVNQEAIYQISIRATAGRRFATLLIPFSGTLSYLWGMAMPGEYYDKPEDAQGYIADPMLDLLAVRSINQASWRNSTRKGAFAGRKIEIELKLPWAFGAIQDEWIAAASALGRYAPAIGDADNYAAWHALDPAAGVVWQPFTFEMFLEQYYEK